MYGSGYYGALVFGAGLVVASLTPVPPAGASNGYGTAVYGAHVYGAGAVVTSQVPIPPTPTATQGNGYGTAVYGAHVYGAGVVVTSQVPVPPASGARGGGLYWPRAIDYEVVSATPQLRAPARPPRRTRPLDPFELVAPEPLARFEPELAPVDQPGEAYLPETLPTPPLALAPVQAVGASQVAARDLAADPRPSLAPIAAQGAALVQPPPPAARLFLALAEPMAAGRRGLSDEELAAIAFLL